MDSHYTGVPEVDALIDAADHEHAESRNLVAVNTAERTVADARLTDIHSQQKAALRRLSAARGLLTKAQKGGDAVKIAAARERETTAQREFDATAGPVARCASSTATRAASTGAAFRTRARMRLR